MKEQEHLSSHSNRFISMCAVPGLCEGPFAANLNPQSGCLNGMSFTWAPDILLGIGNTKLQVPNHDQMHYMESVFRPKWKKSATPKMEGAFPRKKRHPLFLKKQGKGCNKKSFLPFSSALSSFQVLT